MSCFPAKSNRSLLVTLAIVFLPIAVKSQRAAAYTLYESATLGPTGIGAEGLEVNYLQFVGVRFQVTAPATTTRVGAHLVDAPFAYYRNKQIFAALVALSGPSDLPDSIYLTTPDVLGAALLTLPHLSEEVSAPLSVSLAPGWYDLVIGSGQFGASGFGVLTKNNFDIGRPSYYLQFGTRYSQGLGDMRMFVEAIPEPSALLLLLSTLTALSYPPRRRVAS